MTFRWNLSGSYQQVLPRYFSTAPDGSDSRDFLSDAIPDSWKILEQVFLKGYQWPFDPRKVDGSSVIDLLVYRETKLRGRRVFLDYRRNPLAEPEGRLETALLSPAALEYLSQSGALGDTPIERLSALNQPAVSLFSSRGIDLASQPLEIAVCAQHHNGGIATDSWYESHIKGLFVIGEACGSHGIYRPGGAALNAGQVGARRCAQRIFLRSKTPDPPSLVDFSFLLEEALSQLEDFCQKLLSRPGDSNVLENRREAGQWMSRCAGQFRSKASLEEALSAIEKMLGDFFDKTLLSCSMELAEAFRNYDLLVTQKMLLCSMLHAIGDQVASRGSYLVADEAGQCPALLPEDLFRYRLDDQSHNGQIQEGEWAKGNPRFFFRPVRPIPQTDRWFERVWAQYRMENQD